MPEILFSRRRTTPAGLAGNDPQAVDAFCSVNGFGKNDTILPGHAYSYDSQNFHTRSILRKINSLPLYERVGLAANIDEMGDETHILVEFIYEHFTPEQLKKINSLVGASATAIKEARLTGLQQAMLHYENTLLELRKMKRSGQGPGIGARRVRMQTQAHSAFNVLKQAYSRELNRLSPLAYRNKNRGNALSNANRGILLAERNVTAKPDPRINVSNSVQAVKLSGIAKFSNNAGRGAVLIDGALRTNDVLNVHSEGGDWIRQASVQMTGMGLGVAAGSRVGQGTVALLSKKAVSAGYMKAGLVAVGPKGWLVLGVIVGTGLLVGLTVGKGVDEIGKNSASWLWER